MACFARLEDLPAGTGMIVGGASDKPMALFNVGGEVFAINVICLYRETQDGGRRQPASGRTRAHRRAPRVR